MIELDHLNLMVADVPRSRALGGEETQVVHKSRLALLAIPLAVQDFGKLGELR